MTRVAAALVGIVLVAGLLGAAAQPTGRATAEGVVGRAARVASRTDVADVAVLLTVERGDLALVVAYHRDKGWFGVPVDAVPAGAATAWTATRGGGPVPPLSAAYGRTEPNERVRVIWSDHRTATVAAARDGLWVVARGGRVELERVDHLAADGTVARTEAGL